VPLIFEISLAAGPMVGLARWVRGRL